MIALHDRIFRQIPTCHDPALGRSQRNHTSTAYTPPFAPITTDHPRGITPRQRSVPSEPRITFFTTLRLTKTVIPFIYIPQSLPS